MRIQDYKAATAQFKEFSNWYEVNTRLGRIQKASRLIKSRIEWVDLFGVVPSSLDFCNPAKMALESGLKAIKMKNQIDLESKKFIDKHYEEGIDNDIRI